MRIVVNKRASGTMGAAKGPNYPDVVGAITGGKRLAVDALFVAVGSRPSQVAVGQPFEILVLLQNAVNADVDAVLKLTIPDKRFSTTVTKPLRIGLVAGEVGYATLPVSSTGQAKPGAYNVTIEVQVEQKSRGATRVRDANGGSHFNLSRLPTDRQDIFAALNGLSHAAQGKAGGNKATLAVPFEVTAGLGGTSAQPTKPNYVSLWSASDYSPEAATQDRVASQFEALSINRTTLFFPILKTLQDRFEGAHFRLWAGEAVAIAKLMTLALETGLKNNGVGAESLGQQRWYAKLTTMLAQSPTSVQPIERTFTQALFSELLYDAAMLGFSLLINAVHEDFGSPEEMSSFAEGIVQSLSGYGDPLDLTHAYLPLVLGGIIATSRVPMPNEQQRETEVLISTACDNRSHQQNESNDFIFDMADTLLRGIG
jgi:hypothetical protein